MESKFRRVYVYDSIIHVASTFPLSIVCIVILITSKIFKLKMKIILLINFFMSLIVSINHIPIHFDFNNLFCKYSIN